MTQTATQAAWNGIDPRELAMRVDGFTARHAEMEDWTNLWTNEELAARYPNVDAAAAANLMMIENDPALRAEFNQTLGIQQRQTTLPWPDPAATQAAPDQSGMGIGM